MNKIFLTLIPTMLCSLVVQSQCMDDILRSIETNNAELKALLKDNEAADASARAENCVAGPAVEYSPFWQKKVPGLSSSELIVSQEFDFPTLYSSRKKSADMEARALSLRYDEARRELLLEAELNCIELVRLRNERELIEQRLGCARNVLVLIDKMEKEGAITSLDINKMRMEQMSLEAAAQVNEAQQLSVKEVLMNMNSSEPLDFETLDYPEQPMIADFESFRTKALESDAAILAARGEAEAAGREVSLSRKSWLPSLTMGFRRNTAPGEAQNGFLVGMSFPVWSTSHRTRAARARQTAAEMRADEATRQVETRLRSQYNELVLLDKTIRTYDDSLMAETLRLLTKAMKVGQITILQYFSEADLVYGKMQELIDARYRYHTVMASLMRSTL